MDFVLSFGELCGIFNGTNSSTGNCILSGNLDGALKTINYSLKWSYEMKNICGNIDILDILNIVILFINVVVLCIQCILNKQSIKQTKLLSDASQRQTAMLSKTSRFFEYDNLLNGILYEFYISRNEILGLEKNTQKVIDEIDINRLSRKGITQSIILNYKDFLMKFKLSTTFKKLQESGYIFFIKESFEKTIWDNIWQHETLLSLHSHLGVLVNEVSSLDDVVRDEMKELDEVTKEWSHNKIFLEKEETLTNILSCVRKINQKINDYKRTFQSSVNELPENCETYKIFRQISSETM